MHAEAARWLRAHFGHTSRAFAGLAPHCARPVRCARRCLRLSDVRGAARGSSSEASSFPAVYFARQMRATGVDHIHAHFANHPAASPAIHHLTGIPIASAHGSDLHRDRHMLRDSTPPQPSS
jgi:hypothetical protein